MKYSKAKALVKDYPLIGELVAKAIKEGKKIIIGYRSAGSKPYNTVRFGWVEMPPPGAVQITKGCAYWAPEWAWLE